MKNDIIGNNGKTPNPVLLKPWDMIFYSLVIVLLNGHLLGLNSPNAFIFYPDAVLRGQWWRIFTYSFVHVSVYHLALDAGAFLLLLDLLKRRSLFERISHVFFCAAFSLAFACLLSPEIESIGLCGLSGIAHGLMAVTGLVLMTSPKDKKLGATLFFLVLAKSIYEMAAGQAFFESLHLKSCGTPLVACHLGGVAGGVISFLWVRFKKKNHFSQKPSQPS